MQLTVNHQHLIDHMSFEELLRKFRFGYVGNSWLEGGTGRYLRQRLAARRREMTAAEYGHISDKVGFVVRKGWE